MSSPRHLDLPVPLHVTRQLECLRPVGLCRQLQIPYFYSRPDGLAAAYHAVFVMEKPPSLPEPYDSESAYSYYPNFVH